MTKKYSIQWNDDQLSSITINGIRYDGLDDIPDENDREKIMELMLQRPEFPIERSTPSGPDLSKFMLPLFLAIALLMLVISVLTGIQTARNLANEVSISGTVVALTERSDENGNDYYYPVVAIVLPDGQTRSIQISEGSWPPAYSVGDQVTVLYGNERPTSARIQSGEGSLLQWTWTVVTGFLALAFFLASLLVRWILKS